nr:hypothetical protein [uncultured Pedobacter sp.]
MKTIKKLEIDFIGGQEPLTIKEEKALSEYFKNKKLKKLKIGRSS